MYYTHLGTTTISLSDEAYKILKAQKMEGESFSELILRKFGKGNPEAILAYLKEKQPNMDLIESAEKASKDLRKQLKLLDYDSDCGSFNQRYRKKTNSADSN
jgi:predicted CopG family antitoxin